ncbi:MAG: metallophosphoesterase [Chloroflexi bacterium]|nr:metallophosphoesterase [Chloroflexota bacterium]
MSSWTFVFATDIHVGSPRLYRFRPACNDNWQTARRQMVALEPDLLLLGGDITRDGNIHRYELEAVKADLDALPFPAYVVPGNMDTGNKRTAIASGRRDDVRLNLDSASLAQFRSVFGPTEWTFVHKDVRFSGFCSMLAGSGLPDEAAFWDWLEAQRQQPRARYHVWVTHYPLFVDDRHEPNFDLRDPQQYQSWYFSTDEPHRSCLLDVFRATSATLVLSGHVHCRKTHRADGIRFDIGPSTAFPQWATHWPDGDTTLGFPPALRRHRPGDRLAVRAPGARLHPRRLRPRRPSHTGTARLLARVGEVSGQAPAGTISAMPSIAAMAATAATPDTPAMPRVACIVTEYRPRSHADVFVTMLLAGYIYPAPHEPDRFDFHRAARELSEAPLPLDARGRLRRPRVRVASLYTDQVPANDISRALAERAGVPILPTIREALTLGGPQLAVDGVLLFAEHGDYPFNEKGQHLYPRRRFFEETVVVFRKSGRVVPVFNDKHLAYNWADAKWMYDTAKELDIPFMAGSSMPALPLGWRKPPLELPLGTRVHEALVLAHGGLESYGFHALETLQCMVERRAGGETGVAAVQCIGGPEVWDAGANGRWDLSLLAAALQTLAEPRTGEPRTLAREPVVFLLDYRDGLRAAVCMFNGVTAERAFAARVTLPGHTQPQVVATCWAHHSQEPYGQGAYLLEAIQDLVCTGHPPHPVERTLLTTGVLDAAMTSRYEGGRRLETPHLAITYRADRADERAS